MRPATENLKRLTQTEKRHLKIVSGQADEHWRPKTRGDCKNGARPCPYVGCEYHLYLEVKKTGNILYNFPDVEPHEIPCSCVLDVADQGGETLETVGEYLNITRERVRQIQNMATEKLEKRGGLKEYKDYTNEKQETHKAPPNL